MLLYIEEIRKDRYSKLAVWVPEEIPWNANRNWSFSSNKAKLVIQLINNHTKPKLYFDRVGLSIEVDASEELVKNLERLSRIRRNLTQSIFEKLSGVTGDLDKFEEELRPFIDEQILKDNLEAK